MKHCSQCGAEVDESVSFCPACGSALEAQNQQTVPQQTVPQQTVPQQAATQPVANTKLPLNVFGLVGMIAGILAIILVWVSTWIGIVLAIVGIVFSSIGMAKRKNYNAPGFAIAGLVCSIVALVVVVIALIIVIAALAAIAA